MDDEENGGRVSQIVLHRRERGALASELGLRGRGVRIRLQVAAGIHHHAELGEQQRQRQHMHEPTAGTSNQKSLRRRVFPPARESTSSARRKLQRRKEGAGWGKR